MATFYMPVSGAYNTNALGRYKLEFVEGEFEGNTRPVTITAYFWSTATYNITASGAVESVCNISVNGKLPATRYEQVYQDKSSTATIIPGDMYTVFNQTINVTYDDKGECYLNVTFFTSSGSSFFRTSGDSSDLTVNLSKKPNKYTVTYKGSTNDDYGFPSAQSATAGETIVLSDHTPARTGYEFKHWNTEQDGTGSAYAPGAPYTGTEDVFLYAQWTKKTYEISYDSNGGTGAPETQMKIYGMDLTLTTDVPIRKYHTFLGWGTSSVATTITYRAGDIFVENVSIKLYAIWEQTYSEPVIENLKVYRCDSAGNASDDGTYARATGNWSIYDEGTSTVTIEWKVSGTDTWTSVQIHNDGISGTLDTIFGDGNISTENTHIVDVSVFDGEAVTTITRSVPGKAYTVDFMPGGSGVAFGKPAEKTGLFEVDWSAKFNDNVRFEKAIGGRNLLKFTEHLPVGTENRSDNGITVYVDGPSIEITDYGIKFVFSGNPTDALHIPLVYDGCVNNGELMTLSFDYRGNVTDPGYACFVERDGNVVAPVNLNGISPMVDSEEEWKHYKATFSHSEINTGSTYSMILFYAVGNLYTHANWIEIKSGSLKLERGAVPTDWTPAPEDNNALACYPVNSIYISYSHTSPASLFGGTWTRISPYFLYGTGVEGEIGGIGNVSTSTSDGYAYLIKVSIWRRTA